MVAVQLPDGASLGRTTSVARGGEQDRARDTPGVDQVIAISGMSVLDNMPTLPMRGQLVMLKPFG